MDMEPASCCFRDVWVGMSANHPPPNASLNHPFENLPILYTKHGGARIQLVRGPKGLSKDVVLSWKYVQQGGRNQLDMGAYCVTLACGIAAFLFKRPQMAHWMGRTELCVWLWEP